MRLTRLALFAAGLCALGSVVSTAPAQACGGCFSPPNPSTDQTVRQNAERILFVRDEVTKKSTVWVEVRYTGLATEFGWVLPVPKLPKVGVGSAVVFDALDDNLGAWYQRNYAQDENCRSVWEGCEPQPYYGSMDATSSAADAGTSGPGHNGDPSVEILAAGQGTCMHGKHRQDQEKPEHAKRK